MRHPHRLSACVCFCALLLLLVACGGSGGVGPFGIIALGGLFDALPPPVRSLEGSIANDGITDPDAPLRVGDDEDDRSWRAFTSFVLNEPDPGVTLYRARLELYQGNLLNDPYSRLGLLFVERIDMGAGLDVTDFGAPAGARSLGWSDPTVGPILIDVTALVQEAVDLDLRRVDMRLRFGVSIATDKVAQQTHFTSFRNPVAPVTLPPTLRLEWRQAP